MVEQIKVQELTTEEQEQDCGCGCGCGEAQQELVLVGSDQVDEIRQKGGRAGRERCDCSCGCGSQ